VPDVQANSQFQLPSEAFAHTEAGAVIKLEARLSNGDPLPQWLKFNNASGTFSGAPPDGKPTPVEVQVVARDNQAREASVIFKLELGVAPTVSPAPTATLDSIDRGFPVARVSTNASAAEQLRSDEAKSVAGDRLFVLEGVKSAVGNQQFQLPPEAFAHTDSKAVVKLEARQANGQPLPSWVQFDQTTGLFRGSPPDGQSAELEIIVVARDNQAREASVVFKLELGVKGADAVDTSPTRAPSGAGVSQPATDTGPEKSGSVAPVQPGAALGNDTPDSLKLSQQDLAGFASGARESLGAPIDRGFQVARLPMDSLLRTGTGDGQAVSEQRLFVFQGVLIARGDTQFQVPRDAFGHTDPSSMVVLEAHTVDGGALPLWLRFDSVTGIFRGTPPGGMRTMLEIVLTARDEEGREANLSFKLELGVKPNEAEEPTKADGSQAPVEPQASLDGEEDGALEEEAEALVADALDSAVKAKVEKAKLAKGVRPFSEQLQAAKVARDPLLAKILGGETPPGRPTL
jgi:hypothetical protein